MNERTKQIAIICVTAIGIASIIFLGFIGGGIQ
jgi:hypothetical protein